MRVAIVTAPGVRSARRRVRFVSREGWNPPARKTHCRAVFVGARNRPGAPGIDVQIVSKLAAGAVGAIGPSLETRTPVLEPSTERGGVKR